MLTFKNSTNFVQYQLYFCVCLHISVNHFHPFPIFLEEYKETRDESKLLHRIIIENISLHQKKKKKTQYPQLRNELYQKVQLCLGVSQHHDNVKANEK